MSTAQPVSRRERKRLLAEASQFYWYHCVELAPGVLTDGDYDLAPIWPAYGFPEDMSGMNVLDVGRGSGYFAFEFEGRGAKVVATDIGSLDDWDWVGGDEARISQLAQKTREADQGEQGTFRRSVSSRTRCSTITRGCADSERLRPRSEPVREPSLRPRVCWIAGVSPA